MRFSRGTVAAAACLVTLPLAACGSSSTTEVNDNSGNQVVIDKKTLNLVGEIYPLQYLLQRVAGDGFQTTALAGKNVEPHDMELTPDNVKQIAKADLVLTLKGFNPNVDQATNGKKNIMDVSSTVELAKRNGTTDYHFWLDPARMATLSDAVAAKLGELDKTRAGVFLQNAQQLNKELMGLDNSMSYSLKTCKIKTVFTGHPAFGYFVEGTGVTNQSLLGANPETEPNPAQIASGVSKIKAAKVTTIYSEPLVSAKPIQTIATEAKVNTGQLDPIEALADDGSGSDYQDIMNTNLKMLQSGQKCQTTMSAPEESTGVTSSASAS